jgi:adenylosuccinate synthase
MAYTDSLQRLLNDMLDEVNRLFDDYYDAVELAKDQDNDRALDKIRNIKSSLSDVADDIQDAIETVGHRAGR